MLKQTLIVVIPMLLLGAGVGGWQSLNGPPAGRAGLNIKRSGCLCLSGV